MAKRQVIPTYIVKDDGTKVSFDDWAADPATLARVTAYAEAHANDTEEETTAALEELGRRIFGGPCIRRP